MSEYLCKVAKYDWRAAIYKYVQPSTSGLAALLNQMLVLDPQGRLTPAQLLKMSHLASMHAAVEADMPRQQQAWAAARAAASQALDYLDATTSVDRLFSHGLLAPLSSASNSSTAAAPPAAAAAEEDEDHDHAGLLQQHSAVRYDSARGSGDMGSAEQAALLEATTAAAMKPSAAGAQARN